MPRVKLTRSTRLALYFLRFYLVFLMLLLAFRFIKAFHH
jgi:hypothetical protein